MEIPTFNSQTAEVNWMRENKDLMIRTKMMAIKHCDTVSFMTSFVNSKGEVIKAEDGGGESGGDVSEIQVRSVINTTNIMDSHRDVHIKGIWKKSLQEQKGIMLIQEHQMKFDHIISSDVKAKVQFYEWKELGFKFEGKTQALLFDSLIKQERNPFMFDQYMKGYVTNHSVGMRYIQLGFASADESRQGEFALWEKYIKDIANRDEVEDLGYFWPVTEAKIIEGSAVPVGSNFVTPTLSVESKENEPPEGTQDEEPSEDTPNGGAKRSALYF